MLREYYTTKPQAQLDERGQLLMIYKRKQTSTGKNIVYHKYEKVLGYDDSNPPMTNDIYTHVVINVSSRPKPPIKS